MATRQRQLSKILTLVTTHKILIFSLFCPFGHLLLTMPRTEIFKNDLVKKSTKECFLFLPFDLKNIVLISTCERYEWIAKENFVFSFRALFIISCVHILTPASVVHPARK